MAVYEALLLNTVVPQIQAAQAGDSYVMVVNATTPALRITQTGTGNALEVEDSANPDATPFVVSATGDVGIGANAPAAKLDVRTTSFTPTGSNIALLLEDRTAFSQALQFYLNNAGTFFSSRPSGAIGSVNSSDLRISGAGVITGNFAASVNSFIPSTTSAGVISVGGNIDFYTAGSLTAGVAMDMATNLRLRIDTSGNLGLGVTPGSGLTIGGGSAVARGVLAVSGPLQNHQTSMGVLEFNSNKTSIRSYGATAGTGFIAFGVGGGGGGADTQAMTLDASGNLVVGDTNNPDSRRLRVYGIAEFDGNAVSLTNYKSSGTKIGSSGQGDYVVSGGPADGFGIQSQTALVFGSGGTTERARITSDGDFRVKGAGTAGSTDAFQVSGSAPADAARIDSSGNLLIGSATNTTVSNLILNGATRWAVGTQSGGNLFYIVRDSDNVGQYMVNGSTSWTATSDERLKDIIEPITDAANKVLTLRAVIGKFKKDTEGTRRSFLIAQDVQKVLPEAVDVTNPEKLGISYTETIPLLVAAIQEQQAMINELKAEVAALKGA